MRVLILNYEYPPLGGGAGVATQALARGLASRGVRVEVITAGEREECRSEVLWDGHAAEEGLLTVYRVRSRRAGIHEAGLSGAFSYLRAALPLARARMRAEHYDIVHLFFSLPTGALLPFLRLGDTPVIVSLRGSDVPGYDPCQRTLRRAHRLFRPLTRWIWRRATRVVAVCESLGRLALRTDPALRYSVIPNGVDLSRFHPSVRARSRHPHKVRCIAVARLVERKGLGDLIQAIALLERGRYELEIVGSGPDERRLIDLAELLGVGREVIFAGSVGRAAIAGRYRNADIFTLASWEEAFGNVFAEALASGLPIVGSTSGGIPELVEHGKNGFLVPPREPRALAAAIRMLGDDAELRATIGRWNRAQAEANLSWARVTTRYLSLYSGALRRAPARARFAEMPSSAW
ncbi:MAG: glycosyltransferase [Gemmatimonadales bacterium]|nr:glycosyltransferase [Gemmatimonadales bacterium]